MDILHTTTSTMIPLTRWYLISAGCIPSPPSSLLQARNYQGLMAAGVPKVTPAKACSINSSDRALEALDAHPRPVGVKRSLWQPPLLMPELEHPAPGPALAGAASNLKCC